MLKGVYTALITPYKENKKINYEKFIELIEEQINKGVDGLVILGTTGEASSLTYKEKDNKTLNRVFNASLPSGQYALFINLNGKTYKTNKVYTY